MLAKMPIVSANISSCGILRAAFFASKKDIKEGFRLALSNFTKHTPDYLVGSGVAAFYLILKALKRISCRREVILPAYTAGSLVVAVKKAGLKPVLYDIGLDDFSLDISSLLGVVSPQTLAVVCVHMFGIPVRGIGKLKNILGPDIFLIEDCAQSMGTKVGGRETGSFGDVSFFSFNRGKNFSTYSGGCIFINNENIRKAMGPVLSDIAKINIRDELRALSREIAFYLSTKPYLYGIGYPLLRRFKDNAPPSDFPVRDITSFQCSLGVIQAGRAEGDFYKRYRNGMFLLNILKDSDRVILPRIEEETKPVFCRFPLLFRDRRVREETRRRLWRRGFESSVMYGRALYSMFQLGYNKKDFPNAEYLAGRLLTLPVYPRLNEKYLLGISEIIQGA